MILYSDRDDHYSQRVRIVLAENDIGGTYPEDLMNLMRQAVGIINRAKGKEDD